MRAASLACAIWTLTVAAAHAHTMVTPYDLPISFGAYVWACVSVLVLTFVVLTVRPAAPAAQPRPEITLWWVVPKFGQIVAVVLLALTIVSGLFGSPSPVANIAPALFWLGLMLCLPVATALIGDVFQIIHPIAALLYWGRIGDRPRRPYPERLAAWPAFVSYLALAWLELMAPPDPSFLAGALLAYTSFTTAGAVVFGRETWFQRADLFGMFFRMTGKLAPVAYRNDTSGWHAHRRPALYGLIEEPPSHISQLLFVMFMLAATTYDGVWQTSFWAGLYWSHLMAWLGSLWGDDMARAQAILSPGYWVWQRGGLIVAPFVYLAVYWGAMTAKGAMTRSALCVHDLAMRFAWSVIPIALAYMLAHSLTQLLTEIPVIPFLMTDPFGIGWNLLGLERLSAEPESLNIGQIWHFEVALILCGHIATVHSAHTIARVVFTSGKAWLGELPLLLLMMGYTFIGLAVLALPLALHS